MQRIDFLNQYRWNRDRPGGHRESYISFPGWVDGWYRQHGRRFLKRKQRRKERREHDRITELAIVEFYYDLNNPIYMMDMVEPEDHSDYDYDYGFEDFMEPEPDWYDGVSDQDPAFFEDLMEDPFYYDY